MSFMLLLLQVFCAGEYPGSRDLQVLACIMLCAALQSTQMIVVALRGCTMWV
jgi:hypothetical protein